VSVDLSKRQRKYRRPGTADRWSGLWVAGV